MTQKTVLLSPVIGLCGDYYYLRKGKNHEYAENDISHNHNWKHPGDHFFNNAQKVIRRKHKSKLSIT